MRLTRTKVSEQSVLSNNKLGTFAGVFTPSILTILGIILFLRLGYVVGNAGLSRALVMIGLANAISVLTSFSLSAIATNLKVKGGGDYYLISRTLGLEFGGAIGIVLFLAQSVSIAFYCIGFGEAVVDILPAASNSLAQVIAAAAVLFLFVFAWTGLDWATKFQYLVMITLAVSLLSFFAGGLSKWDAVMLSQNWKASSQPLDFWFLFAIFFPAVTGFTQGVSMSGDLKDAGKSLPLGTFLAVGISIAVYFAASVVFAASVPRDILALDYASMRRVALVGPLINAGVIAATLSSAMASFLGAPRILQSMASDRIFPLISPFAYGYGASDNPRRGTLLCTAIALATIALGNLNVVAPIVSMFFLLSYGLLNYATYYEARAASPSFRPRFRLFDARLSLLGCLACIGAMLAINLAAGAVAIAVLFAIYQYLKRTSGPARWADSRRSYYLQRARENLLWASAEAEHPRDWRPVILAFSDDPPRRERILRFASWIEGGSGLSAAVRILEGEGLRMPKQRAEAEKELRKDISGYGLRSFPLVISAPNIQIGISTLVQGFGIGPLRANTILLNWLGKIPKGILGIGEQKYTRNLRAVFRYGYNIVILDADENEWNALQTKPPSDRRIDVWWWGDATSRLTLLLAYLMTRHVDWEEAQIRVLAVNQDGTLKESIDNISKTLHEARIEAVPEIVGDADADAIIKHSFDSTLVFLPFRLRGTQMTGPFGGPVDRCISRLPLVALALAGEDIDLDAEPEEGTAGEIGKALDAFSNARENARKARLEADKTEKEAKQRLNELESAVLSGADKDLMSRVKSAMEAKEESNNAFRRAAKTDAKLQEATRKLEKLGATPAVSDNDSKNSPD